MEKITLVTFWPSRGGDGAEIIYALRNNDTLANLVLSELSNEGQNIRKAYQRRLPNNPSKDYYFMHRNTGNTESIIIEYGFLDSQGDDVNQLKKNWQEYAEAVVRAIVEYLNLSYIPIDKSNYYTVKSGDSLWSIAKKYGVSVSEIKDANGLTNSMLSIGKELLIPVKNESNLLDNQYTVKQGDTLYKIAREFDTTVNDIIKLNSLTSTSLSLGQKLQIPNSNLKNNENQDIDTYVVKKGDTLYKIAKDFNTTINDIKNLNNLQNDILSIGKSLKIPSYTYTVKSGDTLYKIAKVFNTTVNTLKDLNNLNNDILSIGQIIKVK